MKNTTTLFVCVLTVLIATGFGCKEQNVQNVNATQKKSAFVEKETDNTATPEEVTEEIAQEVTPSAKSSVSVTAPKQDSVSTKIVSVTEVVETTKEQKHKTDCPQSNPRILVDSFYEALKGGKEKLALELVDMNAEELLAFKEKWQQITANDIIYAQVVYIDHTLENSKERKEVQVRRNNHVDIFLTEVRDGKWWITQIS
ncbi:MAG: hypothetical protein CL685_03155 [Candidatus Magasanikbacteria bacterium]|nr:hypothetical protein [Candidatus Magasanikbacteria bacterium]|tara:strand:- start:2589 stop:3188 length:600 start_codon:yes stop_codon:yes gene_type:complete